MDSENRRCRMNTAKLKAAALAAAGINLETGGEA